MYRLANNGDVAGGQLAVFQGASEAPISESYGSSEQTRQNSQLAPPRRVALKMGQAAALLVGYASGVVFRNLDDIVDLVDDSMRLCAYWLFWVRLWQRDGVAYVANPLSHWRLHSSNARNRPPGEFEWPEGERVLLESAKIAKLTQPDQDRILLDFLCKCWKWRIQAP